MKLLSPFRSIRPGRALSLGAAVLCLGACGEPESPAAGSAGPPASSEAPAADSAVPAPPGSSSAGSPDGSAAAPASPGPPPLTAAGWGPLRIGMSRAEVVAAAGDDANPNAVGGPEPEFCDEFRPERAPEGMRVMIERDRLTRITVSAGASVRTERGFTVGDPASAIREAYGADAEISPHKYVSAPAAYITVWTTAPNTPEPRGVVYEIGADGRVAHIHAGGPSIRYVEGCL